MRYPFEITKKGVGTPHNLPAKILAQLEESDREENRFIWDGKTFFWRDLAAGDLKIDFFSKKMRYRMQHLNKAQEPLLRALGWKSNERKNVLDLTAGLGRDSALLFFAGFNVTMFERNPVLQILLKVALEAVPMAEFPQQWRLKEQDAIEYLTHYGLYRADEAQDSVGESLGQIEEDQSEGDQSEGGPIELIYLDPMYPERKKSALVKKELRIIRELVGDDPDSEALLDAALESGAERIVVKRPKGAPFVGEKRPNHSVESPNTRFDVYLRSTKSM
ncbi:ribosomal RNA small subunit methyltransferase J [Ignatzschineria indica]|nr:class I SAM-dependent methyltransferase [Ignatzschineria indica]GGZ85760.1 ribosomal RNA small subunit methyltransferase J [Ignatzschineria indica]